MGQATETRQLMRRYARVGLKNIPSTKWDNQQHIQNSLGSSA